MRTLITPLDMEDQEYLSSSVRKACLVGAAKKLLTEEQCKKYIKSLEGVTEQVQNLSEHIIMDKVDNMGNYAFEAAKQHSGLVISYQGSTGEERYVVRVLN